VTGGGPAGLPPPHGEAFRAALTALLGDAPERARLRAAGLARAHAFTWERTAREIDALFAW
jgi:glycosyltransferase involved in cell wall biosynthesis